LIRSTRNARVNEAPIGTNALWVGCSGTTHRHEKNKSMKAPLIAMALADPARYRAFELICGCATISSQALSQLLSLSPATISHHVKRLREADLIDSVRDGRWRMHKANRSTLDAYIAELAALCLGRPLLQASFRNKPDGPLR
jgi:ArsR family transcriptional regulator